MGQSGRRGVRLWGGEGVQSPYGVLVGRLFIPLERTASRIGAACRGHYVYILSGNGQHAGVSDAAATVSTKPSTTAPPMRGDETTARTMTKRTPVDAVAAAGPAGRRSH